MCCSETDSSDYFDSVPDVVVLLIFNKLQDVKSLGRCLLVSKRFSSLVPFTNTISISFPPFSSKPNNTTSLSYTNALRLVLHNLFLKPLKCFYQQIMAPPPKPASRSTFWNASHCHPNGVLKCFKDIKSLHLELPSHGDELGSDSGASFLKWKAEYFGSNLKACIILGATSFQRRSSNQAQFSSSKQESCVEHTLTDDELKLRIIWTISCLIASSTRHYLLKRIVGEHPIPMLQTVMISDTHKQGKLYMGKEGIVEMRDSQQETLESSSSSMERTVIPEVSMKLWYLPMVELPKSGYVMTGATLVLIRPSDVEISNNDSDLMVGGLGLEGDDEVAFSEAVKEMIKVKKSYLMTMSSF